MLETTVLSFDDGYGFNKLYDGENTMLVPTACCSYTKKYTSENDNSTFLGVEIEGISGKYLVGETALQQAINMNWLGGNNKHIDIHFPIIAKTCLALASGSNDDYTINTLVMGLPVNSEENEYRHLMLENIVLGTHKVCLIDSNGRTRTKTINVENVITKKQPFGSFCDLLFNDRIQIDTELASGFNVVIDIGTRTLNVYTLDALEPVIELSDTFNQGVFTAYQEVGNLCESEFGQKIQSGRLSYIVSKRRLGNHDISSFIEYAYDSLANEIVKIIETMFSNSWGYVNNIVVTGGGAEFLQERLRPYLPLNTRTRFLNKYSTAKGFWKYGVHQHIKQGKPVSIRLSNGGVLKVGEKRA